jgi:HNH endonuclease
MSERKSTKIERACETCGKAFLIVPSATRHGWGRFCSNACKHQRAPRKIQYICPVCRTVFYGFPCHARRSLSHCCSIACNVVWRTPSLTDRFWDRVGKKTSGGCILWTGTICKGYGVINEGGRSLKAHRISYELMIGPIPEGLRVLHDCPDGDNPRCINPQHLWLGTDADNMADKVSKGRGRAGVGERNRAAILKEGGVRKIRRRYETGRFTMRELGEQFGVCDQTISLIVNRKTWAHVK